MNSIEKKRLLVKDIKTTYHQRTNSKEFLVSLSKFTKMIFPIDRTVVHAGTSQIIAHGQHYDAAVLNGDEYIEVALADFPEKYLIHAVATHSEPPTETVKLHPLIPVFMKYYNAKENGDGAEFREDAEDKSLREFVACALNTNKTYLDWIEAVGNFKPELLAWVDKGEISLQEAYKMVPKPEKTKKGSGKGNGGKKPAANNYMVPVTDASELTPDERITISSNLPVRFSEHLEENIFSADLSIAKGYTYNHTFQGYFINYEYEGKSVATQIIESDSLRNTLLKAA